jgi:hypothetical protein
MVQGGHGGWLWAHIHTGNWRATTDARLPAIPQRG